MSDDNILPAGTDDTTTHPRRKTPKTNQKKRTRDEEQSYITLKLDELRACTTTANIITRKNYTTMLEACPPDLFKKIINRLFLAAVTDQTGQAAFAALQYLIGKPAPVCRDRNAALEDIRELVRLQTATKRVDVDPE